MRGVGWGADRVSHGLDFMMGGGWMWCGARHEGRVGALFRDRFTPTDLLGGTRAIRVENRWYIMSGK